MREFIKDKDDSMILNAEIMHSCNFTLTPAPEVKQEEPKA